MPQDPLETKVHLVQQALKDRLETEVLKVMMDQWEFPARMELQGQRETQVRQVALVSQAAKAQLVNQVCKGQKAVLDCLAQSEQLVFKDPKA